MHVLPATDMHVTLISSYAISGPLEHLLISKLTFARPERCRKSTLECLAKSPFASAMLIIVVSPEASAKTKGFPEAASL